MVHVYTESSLFYQLLPGHVIVISAIVSYPSNVVTGHSAWYFNVNSCKPTTCAYHATCMSVHKSTT